MSVTIDDISKQLGLSISTVSKALNNYTDISQETKNRVLEAAQEMGYHPSAAARNLRRRRTDKVGFLFSFPVTTISEYAAKLITGAIIAAEQADYNLILYPVLNNQFDQLTRICRTREVDGLLLISRANMDQISAIMRDETMPYVVIGRRAEQPDVSYINLDYINGAINVVSHLISLGHRRIAYTTRPALGITSRDRLQGYKQALQAANIPFDESLVIPTNLEPKSGYHAMNQLLDLPNPPTAIFAIHDLVAIECLQAIQDRGLRVPDDIAVVGFDDWSLCLTTKPPLTSVRTPLTDMGQQAMAALVDQINKTSQSIIQKTLPVELIVRQSTVGSLADGHDKTPDIL